MGMLRRYEGLSVGAKAAIWFTACNALNRGINFITMPFLTRAMPDAQYGVVTVYNSWLAIILAVVALNIYGSCFNTAMMKYEERRPVLLASGFTLILGLCAVAFAVGCIGLGLFERLFTLPGELVLCIAFNVFATAEFALWAAYQRFEYGYRSLFALTVVFVVLPAVASVVTTWLWPVADQKAVVKVVSQLCVSVPVVACLGLSIMRKARFTVDFGIWKYLLLFAIPLLPHYLSMIVLGQSDRIMIASMVGQTQAAYYAVSYQISIASSIVITAMTSAVVPWLYRMMKAGAVEPGARGKVATVSAIAAAVNFMLAAAAPEIICVFAPESYREAMYLIPAIAGSTYFSYLYGMFVNVELYYEKKRYTVIISLVAALLNVGLNWLLIPVFGYQVSAYTTLICYALMGLGHTIAAKRVSRDSGIEFVDARAIWGIAALLIVANQAVTFVYPHPFVRYLSIAAIVAAAVVNRDKVRAVFKKSSK